MKVGAGVYDHTDVNPPAQLRDVAEFITHPSYGGKHDITPVSFFCIDLID